MESDVGSDQVEWLDLGPPDPSAGPGPQRRGHRPWYLLAAAVAVSVILVAALTRDTKHSTATPSHRPTDFPTVPTTVRAPSTEAETSPTQTPSVEVVSAGVQSFDVPAGWALFGRDADLVVRIELASGRVTRTSVPSMDSSQGGLSFVVTRDRAMIQPFDSAIGYVVRDGRPARSLSGTFGLGGPVLPGPDLDHVWIPDSTGTRSVLALASLDGRRVGPTIRVPVGPGAAEPDGAGYVRFSSTGGVYEARPDGIERITSGDLIATGPTRWLTKECDAQFHCATTIIDRATGARHTLESSFDASSYVGFSSSVISPDGSLAAIVRIDAQGAPQLTLLDLITGAVHTTSTTLNSDQAFSGVGVLVWSADSRWLFIAADAGRVLVLDRRTLGITELGTNLPSISQLAFRNG